MIKQTLCSALIAASTTFPNLGDAHINREISEIDFVGSYLETAGDLNGRTPIPKSYYSDLCGFSYEELLQKSRELRNVDIFYVGDNTAFGVIDKSANYGYVIHNDTLNLYQAKYDGVNYVINNVSYDESEVCKILSSIFGRGRITEEE